MQCTQGILLSRDTLNSSMTPQAVSCDALTGFHVSNPPAYIRSGVVVVAAATVVVEVRRVHLYVEHEYPHPSSWSPRNVFAYVPDFRGPPVPRWETTNIHSV